MNAIFLLIPFFAVRFGLLVCLDPAAVGRAAYFAPMQGRERIAYYSYQLSNIILFLYLCFLTIKVDGTLPCYAGWISYVLGLGLCAISIVDFAAPDDSGFSGKGIYRFSRNPMYVAYFICFVGMALLTKSWILFGIVLIFQISAHWIILAEERWCAEQFGERYQAYQERVRRYV